MSDSPRRHRPPLPRGAGVVSSAGRRRDVVISTSDEDDDAEAPLTQYDQSALCASEPPPNVQDKLQARIDAMRRLKYGYAQNTCE
jgi:hypothetical protein